jgi:hypothetical protein
MYAMFIMRRRNRKKIWHAYVFFNLQFSLRFLLCAIFSQPANLLQPRPHPHFVGHADGGSSRVALIGLVLQGRLL